MKSSIDKSLMSNYIDLMKRGDEIISLVSEIRERANKIIVEELKKRGIEDLAPSHGAILVQLYKNKTLCMKDMARLIKKDKSTITALVNKLVKLGYIEKIKDREDSRITMLRLTGKGADLEDIFLSVSGILMEKTYRGFEESEKKQLKNLLNKMKENL